MYTPRHLDLYVTTIGSVLQIQLSQGSYEELYTPVSQQRYKSGPLNITDINPMPASESSPRSIGLWPIVKKHSVERVREGLLL